MKLKLVIVWMLVLVATQVVAQEPPMIGVKGFKTWTVEEKDLDRRDTVRIGYEFVVVNNVGSRVVAFPVIEQLSADSVLEDRAPEIYLEKDEEKVFRYFVRIPQNSVGYLRGIRLKEPIDAQLDRVISRGGPGLGPKMELQGGAIRINNDTKPQWYQIPEVPLLVLERNRLAVRVGCEIPLVNATNGTVRVSGRLRLWDGFSLPTGVSLDARQVSLGVAPENLKVERDAKGRPKPVPSGLTLHPSKAVLKCEPEDIPVESFPSIKKASLEFGITRY